MFLAFCTRPGRVVRGTVVGVQDFGLFIKLSETIKALCPLSHLTDVSRSKISTKFEVQPLMVGNFCMKATAVQYHFLDSGPMEPRILLVPPE